MATEQTELHIGFPFIRVYKNGHVERLLDTDSLPPGTDPHTGVSSKDVHNIVPETDEVYVRIYLPNLNTTNVLNHKFPLLFYIHGGAFCLATPASSKYHNYLNTLVSEAQVIAVAVHHRRAPEYPLPIGYEDSFAALQWVASHRNRDGPEEWLNSHADFGRVFVAGDSAGGNIAHNVVMAAGKPEAKLGFDILGLALGHPFFWSSDPIGSESSEPGRKAMNDKLWPFVCPSSPGFDDPRVNPTVDGGASLVGLGCRRVLVCVAGKDILKDRGRLYCQVLGRSGWKGVVEIEVTEEEDHFFHWNLQSENAKLLIKRLAAFFNSDMPPLLH